MRDSKIPLFAGLLVLILAGVAVGLAMLNSPESATNTPHVASDDGAFEPLDESDPLPGSGTRSGKNTPRPDGTKTPDESYPPPKPVIKIETAAAISGAATDYFDDPAAGVILTLLAEDSTTTIGPTTVTDSEGVFRFETKLNEGDQYFVACLEEDKALTATAPFTIEKDRPVEGLTVKVFAAARAFGVVINGDTREPLADVELTLEGRKDDRTTRLGRLLGRVHPIKSSDDGKFEIGHVAPGKYIVRAGKTGWIAHEFNPITRSVQEMSLDEYANFELLPFILVQAGVIEGKVLRKSDNTPVAGATVELGTVIGGNYATVVTDTDGAYRFDTVPPGIGAAQGPGSGMGGVAVRASAPGFAMATRDLRVSSGQTRSGINLLLDSGCTVTGIVYDNKNVPVANARVYFNDTPFLQGSEMVAGIGLPARAITTTTDTTGAYTLSGLAPGAQTITASASGFANKSNQVTLVVGTPSNSDFVLEPAGSIEGHVTNDRGDPIEGVPIAAYEASGPDQLGVVMKVFFGEELPDRGESTMFPASVRTDAEGFYRVDGLKATEYVLLANSRDFAKYVSPNLEVKAGAVVTHDFVLATGGTIFGRAYDANGQGESGVTVTCAAILGQDTPKIRTAYTDRSGNYELTGLSPATYNVIRNDGDFTKLLLPNPANQVAVKAGERVQFDIYTQKPGTARIYGRVTLDGKAYAEESLVLLGGSVSGFAANTGKTDANGSYEFRSVPLGTYQIAQSRGPMPSLVRKRVRVDREGDIEINIDFVTCTIRGRVELEGGEVPKGKVTVLASPVSADGEDATADDDKVNGLEMMVYSDDDADPETGEFEIKGLSPGFYRLTARSEQNGMVMKPYLNVRASVAGVILTLPREGAKMKGTVTGLEEAVPGPFGLIAALIIEDSKGQPLALGALDSRFSDNAVDLKAKTEFEVRNLPEGTYTVTVSLPGYAPVTHKNVKFSNGQMTTLAFAFATSGNVRVKLLNAEVGVETAFELEYEIKNSKGEIFEKRFSFLDFFNPDGSTSQNGDDNSFVIKDLPPESYTITLTLPGYNEVSESFTIVAGETADVSVQFEPE